MLVCKVANRLKSKGKMYERLAGGNLLMGAERSVRCCRLLERTTSRKTCKREPYVLETFRCRQGKAARRRLPKLKELHREILVRQVKRERDYCWAVYQAVGSQLSQTVIN